MYTIFMYCIFNCIYVKTGLILQWYVTALSRVEYHVINNSQAKCVLKYIIYIRLYYNDTFVLQTAVVCEHTLLWVYVV